MAEKASATPPNPGTSAQDTETTSNPASNSSSNDSQWWLNLAESVTRVTLVGLAGSIVGLAKERQEAAFAPPPPQTQARGGRRTAPPRPIVNPRTTGVRNLPALWSISCMVFAIVLETSRRSSPTSRLLELLSDVNTHIVGGLGGPWEIVNETFEARAMHKAAVAIGDYFIGGTIAGLAGAVAQRKRDFSNPAFRKPSSAFGIATGMSLGLFAGILQASVDVASLYFEEKGSLADQLQQQQLEDMAKQMDLRERDV